VRGEEVGMQGFGGIERAGDDEYQGLGVVREVWRRVDELEDGRERWTGGRFLRREGLVLYLGRLRFILCVDACGVHTLVNSYTALSFEAFTL